MEEEVLLTALKHLPEIQNFHRACTVYNDRALEEQLLLISCNGSRHLLEVIEVPLSLQLIGTVNDILTCV